MPAVAHIIRRRRARQERKQVQRRRSAFWTAVIAALPTIFALVPLITALGLAFWLYAKAANVFPDKEDTIGIDPSIGVTQFLDRQGKASIHSVRDALGEERRWVYLDELPDFVADATIVMEDRDVRARHRFDLFLNLTNMWRYMLGAPLARDEGIAGDLVRNAFLPLARKSGLDDSLLEAVLVAESRRRLSNDELLEWHLNTNYYGNDAYGIEAAAQVYLGKAATELSLADAALLAAVAPAPRLNLLADELVARQRQADLLFAMLEDGLIDQRAFDLASVNASIIHDNEESGTSLVGEFLDYAREQAQAILDEAGYDGARLLARGGLQVITTLDLDLQMQAECVVRSHLDRLAGRSGAVSTSAGYACVGANELLLIPGVDPANPPNSAALVLLDVRSGEILSMVGAALADSYQPAVVLQPFVYMEGFLRRLYTPASMVYDIPQVYPGPADGLIFSPSNPDGRFRGPLNLRDAMAGALLPPAVQVANSRGIDAVIRTAHRIGFSSVDGNRQELELLERGGAVSVLDTGYAYSVLASMGVMRGIAVEPADVGFRGRAPAAILRIADAEGKVIWVYDGADRAANETVIFEQSLAYMVNDILADAAARRRVLDRPDSLLQMSYPVAVVDGLSEDKRDSWTVGYTPNIALTVHVGRDDGAAMGLDHYGRAGSAPIWRALMNYLHKRDNLPAESWPVPQDIEEYLVCEISGLLPPATDHCPTRREIMPAGSPLRRDTFWQTVEINSLTGQRATVTTADSLRRQQAFFLPPDDIMDWWIANGNPLPPSTYGNESRRDDIRAVQLDQPLDYAYIGGTVEIAGSINEPDAVYYLLQYGAGVSPKEWVEIKRESGVDLPHNISAIWDSAGMHGVHTIRLTALFDEGNSISDTRQVTLDNSSPSIELRTSDGRHTVTYPANRVIALLADASDNLTIERIEFYLGAEILGSDRDWPYGFEYEITDTGSLTFMARVFDQVGNSAESNLTVTVVESS